MQARGSPLYVVAGVNTVFSLFEVPEPARHLLDELTLWGDETAARTALDRWYAAGAEMPTVCLPPGRPVAELDEMLDALRPR